MALKALLFDVDGTLADTEAKGHLPAYNLAFEELGLSWRWSPELYRELLLQPGGRERIRHYLKHHNPLLQGDQRKASEDEPQRWVEQLHDVKSRHFRDLLEAGEVPLRRGVRRLVREACSNGLEIAIVTNASRRTLEPLLSHSLSPAVCDAVCCIVSGEDVAHKKPAPDLYRLALRRLGLQALECVAIEDSAMGLEAAQAAGIPTLITVNDDTREHDFSNAMLVIDHLGDQRHPFTVLDGHADRGRRVTVPFLRRLHEKAVRQKAA